MESVYWNIDFDVFDLQKDLAYCIEGWVYSMEQLEPVFSVFSETGENYTYTIERILRPDVAGNAPFPVSPMTGFRIYVADVEEKKQKGCKNIQIVMTIGNRKEIIFEKDLDVIWKEYLKKTLLGNIDILELHNGNIVLEGWVYSKYGKEKVQLLDENGNAIPCKMRRIERVDVNKQHGLIDSEETGFEIVLPRSLVTSEQMIVHLENEVTTREFPIVLRQFDFDNTKLGKYKKVLGLQTWKENRKYIKKNGLDEFRYHVIKEMNKHIADYDIWAADHKTKKSVLERQRKTKFQYNPLISIVIPLYNTPEKYLKELIDSVRNQTYEKFELCLADGSTSDDVGNFIKNQYSEDTRIIYQRLEKNQGISINTNAAFAMAQGDFIMLSDHDDTLEPDALYELVKAINENPEIDAIYTDEDKVTMDGKRFYDPHFKPDYNLELLCSNNYICHIFAVRKSIVDQVGVLRHEYDGAQDYDFILRCCEKARVIYHVPKVLYHWRSHPASTAGNPESKLYAYEAGCSAVKAHYDRLGIPAMVERTEHWGRYRSTLLVQGSPMISLVLASNQALEQVEKCVRSILEQSSYSNLEIIVIQEKGKDFFQIEQMSSKVKILSWDKEYDKPAMLNYGASKAKGMYLLFMDVMLEVKTENWMEEMLGYIQRDEVGVVGAKLLYPDETIQHAGVILGIGPHGTRGYLLEGQKNSDTRYVGRIQSTQNLCAVTGDCMLTSHVLFDKVNGFNQEMSCYYDTDYCLRIREEGKSVIYHAFAELYSTAEKRTEGLPEDNQNGNSIKLFRKRWKKNLKSGDPYYNSNLSQKKTDCSLKL